MLSGKAFYHFNIMCREELRYIRIYCNVVDTGCHVLGNLNPQKSRKMDSPIKEGHDKT